MNMVAFLSYAFLTSFTPGPNNIMSMTVGSKYGFKKGFRFNLGVLIGFFVILICSTIFSKLLYNYIPKIEPVMMCIGALYILWLAWIVWRDKPQEGKGNSLELNRIFTGAVLQFINVKVILYSITVMSTFVLPYYQSIPALSGFIVLLAFMGFCSTCCWSLFGAAFEKLFENHKKVLNGIMALLLVYCAVSLILEVFS